MRTLSSTAIEEKNKLIADSIWYLALMITIPGLETPIRLVRNNADITWNGSTWSSFPFEIDEVGDISAGEVPRVDVRVSNISRAMESYIQAYDTYVKTNGFSPILVNIYVLNSLNLASATPEVEHLFELKQPKTNSRWATFTLGAANPFNKRFPIMRILKNHCRFIFKGTLCGYAGIGTVCDKTLTICRTFTDSTYHNPPSSIGNSTRFGGFPGVGARGIRLA